ncbi:oligopeptide/dipeptide ABC transporter ATP-binding protein [Rhizobium sp. BK418]|uniref:ABC transporter ATP-binding protein n=1 Tax=Rhizobium sp. BK418 TaxID=2512120 RepID=UPI0010F11108|nr:oligopeptide/dipeptide ABC transporter ATP-binding protein [Rhizobium sp. BK418]TCS03141.1 peptide/nickel transport system ATP-binding protein [Rhizobium sp. BK418]
MNETIFEAKDLSRSFMVGRSALQKLVDRLADIHPPAALRAVDNVSLSLKAGETLGVVGESGCGKSTLARMIAGILPISSGERRFRGEVYESFLARKKDALKIQMVFQDPLSSLNPRLRVGEIVGEAAVLHGLVRRSKMRDYVIDILARVGLPADSINRYPHQFSGGQRQRVGIARALAVKPDMLICDEAVAALDVSVQAQIINLLMDIKRDSGLAMIFISHDLGVIRHLCDRVAVMYLGRVVELAETEQLFAAPTHPYTRMLLDGMPKISLQRRQFMPINGEIPSPLNPPSGCHFHPRCPMATDQCCSRRPELREAAPGHMHACLNIEPG